ncbi:phage holin family protein [Nesterenkonia flava]|uniref:Phage holin family protein n=1 Tax=Nesterenkonia flava TaxID=469799 RepID=A0ABU1FR18_9MICC|nr:phage holin family protein [Nesterenkonia flava]MDR5711095.1 phage holin family protein [Nesterenkonia flava]
MAKTGTAHKGTAPRTSLFDLIKVVLRLGPKQITDEIQLAIGQMKAKGIAAGIAAGLMVVGLVFVTFLVVALIVAAIAAFALIFELWAAALIVAGIFLLIAVIFALIGVAKFKKAMPLVPEDAIRGLRMDLGVAREGTDFDPRSLDRADEQKRKAKEEAKRRAAEDKKKPGAGQPTQPTYRELLRRTALRRDHIAGLQDQLTSRLPKRKVADDDLATSPLDDAPQTAQPTPAGAASSQDDPAAKAKEFVSARWKPLSVAAGSAAAGAVFLRELIKK